MKRMLPSVLFALTVIPVPVRAQSSFDGTWKIDLSKTKTPTKPDIYLLQDRRLQCPTCDPIMDVKADGTDQQITGEPCYNAVNIKILNDRAIEETDKRDGQPVRTLRIEVSQNTNEATFELTDKCNKNADPVIVKWLATRVAQAPAGSHVISGSWRTLKQESASANALLVTLKLENNSFSFRDPAGQSYTAKLDGTEAPFTGGVDNTFVSVRRVSKNTIEETDKRDGKIIRTTRFTVAANGKTMTATITDALQRSTIQFVLEKQ
jgi:hypothetical protein